MSDGPYQDFKDVKKGVNDTARAVNKFATHSTSRVIGPMATRALEKCKELFHNWFDAATSEEPPEENPDVQDT